MDKRVKRMKGVFLFGNLLAGVLIATSVAVALEIGDQAPDFSLPSTTGGNVSLSQFRGKKHVLVQFYSMDFNPS